MASFNFYVKNPKDGNGKLRKTERPIYLYVTISKSVRIPLNTDIRVVPGEWNFKAKCYRSSAKGAPEKNAELQKLKANVELGFMKHRDLEKPELKLKLQEIISPVLKREKSIPRLSELVKDFEEDMRGSLSDNYLDGFQQVINFLHGKSYKGKPTNEVVAAIRDVRVDRVGEAYIKEYRKWMLHEGFKDATIHKHLKFIKHALTNSSHLYTLDLTYSRPKNVKVKEGKSFWLKKEEVKLLELHQFDWEKRIDNKAVLARVRDYGGFENEVLSDLLATRRDSPKWQDVFDSLKEAVPDFVNTIFCPKERIKDEWLFRYKTGVRHQDSAQFMPHHFTELDGVWHIDFNMLKNGRNFFMPISNEAMKIADKYNRYLPKISQQDKDRLIKACFQESGLSGVSERVSFSGSERLVEIEPKYSMITTHTARKSFGRRWMEQHNDIESLSQYYGHSSSAVTRAYIGWHLEEYADMVKRINF
ncbi:MAG: tyrosine-type recombinase/integrase [Roseivirga sp.]|nr:tyrosine-type recombinase/integrase [Roseivirga sp.]